LQPTRSLHMDFRGSRHDVAVGPGAQSG
jgi:hypothetical protein